MSAETWATILAPIIGIVLTVVYRLVDKFIPDETGTHPLPVNAGKTATAAGGTSRDVPDTVDGGKDA